MPSPQEVIAEAIAGSYFRMGDIATLLGETEDRRLWPEASMVTWFRLGEKGRQSVIISIARIDKGENRGCVQVKYEWLNLSGEAVIRGQETGTINCNLPHEQVDALNPAALAATERGLMIFKDVLEGVGVAGPIQDLAPESHNTEDEADDEAEAPTENEVW